MSFGLKALPATLCAGCQWSIPWPESDRQLPTEPQKSARKVESAVPRHPSERRASAKKMAAIGLFWDRSGVLPPASFCRLAPAHGQGQPRWEWVEAEQIACLLMAIGCWQNAESSAIGLALVGANKGVLD